MKLHSVRTVGSILREEPTPVDLEPRTPPKGMSPCCARCKTPFGHSALAGVCCHIEPKGTK